eukprot:TRINITY_DN12952_c0_g3_i1.p1 TRINITY_DN12952_c0_g3~~TRINITY_DN12952_c0_g3_i1.p1  ORF type:complete len:474 (+),score=52.64 TRINITY_DN12952_c0_g3_i1:40-1461(+)
MALPGVYPYVGRLRRRAPQCVVGHNVMDVVEDEDEVVERYMSEEEVSIAEELGGFEVTPPGSPVGEGKGETVEVRAVAAPQPSAILDMLPAKFVSQLQFRQVLGEGSFGHVFLATSTSSRHNRPPAMYAIKKVMVSHVSAETILQEVKTSKDLTHPNVIETVGAYKEANAVNIVMKFYPGGTLSALIESLGRLTDDVARVFAKDIIRGVEYLHRNNVIHRDLKGANMMLDENCSVRIGDFGSSRAIDETATNYLTLEGTPAWMAPEVIKQSGHSFPADIWSIGCTVIEMLTGRPPFADCRTPHATMFAIASDTKPIVLPKEASPHAKEVLNMCLIRDPEKRASPSTLLATHWLTKPINYSSLQRHRVVSYIKTRASTYRRASHSAEADFSALDAFLEGTLSDPPTTPSTPKDRRPKRGASTTGIRRLPPAAADRPLPTTCKQLKHHKKKKHLTAADRCHSTRHVVLPLIHQKV